MKEQIKDQRRRENLQLIREGFENLMRQAERKPGLYTYPWTFYFLHDIIEKSLLEHETPKGLFG